MSPSIAWLLVLTGLVAPLIHVLIVAGKAAPEGSRCPFSPRAGWAVLVLFLGPIGWFMFMHARHRQRAATIAINPTDKTTS